MFLRDVFCGSLGNQLVRERLRRLMAAFTGQRDRLLHANTYHR